MHYPIRAKADILWCVLFHGNSILGGKKIIFPHSEIHFDQLYDLFFLIKFVSSSSLIFFFKFWKFLDFKNSFSWLSTEKYQNTCSSEYMYMKDIHFLSSIP